MLALLQGGDGLLRVEVRRALDDHAVHLLFEQAQITIKARVPVGRFDLQFVTKGIDSVLKVVVHGHDAGVAVLVEQIGDPAAASAAADEPQLDCRVGRSEPSVR